MKIETARGFIYKAPHLCLILEFLKIFKILLTNFTNCDKMCTRKEPWVTEVCREFHLWNSLKLLLGGIMKEFYTYEQQIQKLKKKGLIITDESDAIEFLKLEGYYNVINGYSPNFKNNGVLT